MDIKKAIIVNVSITILILILGVKVYADFNGDKKDYDQFIEIETQEELDKVMEICNKKEYFKPMCEIYAIKIKQLTNAEACEKIQFHSIPYYLTFHKEQIIMEIEDLRNKCIENSEGVIVIT